MNNKILHKEENYGYCEPYLVSIGPSDAGILEYG